jgi:DNA-binding NarL/FixJ family response regulator
VDEQVLGNRIRVVLLAGQGLFRASLGRFLSGEPNLEVVGEFGNSSEALTVIMDSNIDVVLVDGDDGSEVRDRFLTAAREHGFRGRFLVIASAVDIGNTSAAIRLGASGIFLKSEAPDRLVQAIQLVANGAVWLDQRIVRQLAELSAERFGQFDERDSTDYLTDREQKVLQGIVKGLTNKKIGENLGLSEGSVKTSVQQLFHRAGVRRRSQLVRAALEGTLGSSRIEFERLTV